jgi:hypothetical protein
VLARPLSGNCARCFSLALLRNTRVRGGEPTAVDVNNLALAVGGHLAKELLPSLDRRDRPRVEAIFRPAQTSCAARRTSLTAARGKPCVANFERGNCRKIGQITPREQKSVWIE